MPATTPTPAQPVPPAWADRLVAEDDRFRLFRAVVPEAESLDAEHFVDRCAGAYEELGAHILREPDFGAVRFWNFVPGILGPLGAFPHRYMAFNAGRVRGYDRWRREGDPVPTATGVGTSGPDLVLYALAGRVSCSAVENPRQVPSYEYSDRFGTAPPVFSRATRLSGDVGLLVVGGTASVRGEDSVHDGNVEAQTAETLLNLAAVVASAGGPEPHLASYRSVRVYHPRGEDRAVLRTILAEQLPASCETEFVVSDLCRPELLVEIEGVADLPE